MTWRNLILPFTGFVILVCAACKPVQSESELQTLNNMTRTGELKLSQCGHNQDGLADMSPSARAVAEDRIVVPDHLRPELYLALSSVPANLKNAFFELGYRVVVSSDIASQCNAESYDRQEEMASCLEHRAVAGSEGEVAEEITIHLNAKAEDIRHATVRAFFLALTKSISFIQEVEGELVVTNDENPEFKQWKSDLALAVIDVVANDPSKSLRNYAALLPADDAFLSQNTSTLQRRLLWENWRSNESRLAEKFMDLIIAESADSYYCSQRSKDDMAESFPEAYDLFAMRLDPALRQMWSDGSQELSLTGYRRGGWFPGRAVVNRRAQLRRNHQQTGFYRPRLAGYRRPWDGSGTWVRPPAWGSGQRLGWRHRY